MATQTYSPPRPGTQPARPGKFTPGQLPEILAIVDIPGELVPSEFGASEVRFRLTDGRNWYVPQSIADEIYQMRIVPRQSLEVVKFGRAKHELRIVPLQQNLDRAPSAERDYSPELTRSIEIANERRGNGAQPIAAPPTTPALSQQAACMMASMCSAVDAIIETQAYATRKGLGLTFSEESVRAIGLSIYIDACRNGGAR